MAFEDAPGDGSDPDFQIGYWKEQAEYWQRTAESLKEKGTQQAMTQANQRRERRDWETDYYRQLNFLADRYIDQVAHANIMCNVDQDFEHDQLGKFLLKLKEQIAIRAPLQKMNRWLGNIQGKVHMLGYTTDDAERNFTRPTLRPLDYKDL